MAQQSISTPPGFLPGTGPKGERYGRDPVTGRAYKADATVRAERKTLSPDEKVAQIHQQAEKAMAGVGRSVMRVLPSCASLMGAVGIFQKHVKDARAYETSEKVTDRKAYFLRMAALADAKHAAAVAWLPKAAPAIEALATLNASIGTAFATFRKANGRAPSVAEQEVIVARILTPDVRATIEAQRDPANDPFGSFRKDADDHLPTTDGDDADTLGDEDGDEDGDNG